jgi:hypothetical protein
VESKNPLPTSQKYKMENKYREKKDCGRRKEEEEHLLCKLSR